MKMIPTRAIQASRLSVGALLLFVTSSVEAQRGDREGHDMQPPPDHWKIPAAPVLSPEDEAKTFALEEGFRAELVAAEPMVHDPVAITFDGNGRIWVAEMRGYMPDIDGKNEMETLGRISVLEDTDGDGTADKHTVFLEDVLLPRAVALTGAGKSLLYSDNESLYEVEILIDEKGNLSAGKQIVVDEKYASGGNPEHKSNGLFRSIDNWIYSAKCDKRYRKVEGEWVKEETEGRGQWGIDQDNYGRLITNTNSNLVTVEEVVPGVTIRNHDYSFSKRVTSRVEDQSLFPSRINPGVNRGYLEGTLDEDGYLTKPTAASGVVFYRGDQYPAEYRGNIFIPEPSGNLVKRLAVSEGEDGYREIFSALKDSEFFTSTDERSRIVSAYTAPDGTLYLVDFYRGIIQHAVYMTSYLRAQVVERKLFEPVGKGRIWRVVHTGGDKPGPTPTMQEEASTELVAHLSHPNGWWRDTAQRLLVERGGKEAVASLKKLAGDSGEPLGQVHAIWTLEGLGEVGNEDIAHVLKSSDPYAAAQAVRVAETLSDSGEKDAIFATLQSAMDREDWPVRRQLATTLPQFGSKGCQLAAGLVAEHAEEDPLLVDLAMSGLGGREWELLSTLDESHPLRSPLLRAAVSKNENQLHGKLLSLATTEDDYKTLGSAAVSKRRKALVLSLLDKLTSEDISEASRKAAVRGMIAGGKERGFKPMPVATLHPILSDKTEFPGVSKDDRKGAIKLFAPGSDEEVVYLKTKADQEQFKLGEAHYQRICLGCHQSHGNGQQFLAPPLVGSEWVEGPKRRLIALVMDGLQGPIEVSGKKYQLPDIQPLMPGLRANPEFTDEQLAAIMTYVRNAWGNGATPVSTKEVQKYRAETEMRAPWTPEEVKSVR